MLLRCLLLLIVALPAAAQSVEKRIAVTLDDGPVTRFFAHPSPEHRAGIVDGLAGALDAHGAPATLFAIGHQLDGNPEGVALLRRWLAAGVGVGNHTVRHRALDAVPTPDFLADVDRASAMLEPLLAEYGQRLRHFRAPYLLDGGTAAKQGALLRHLDRRGLANAPATFAVEDWRFNADYEATENEARRREIGAAYLRHVEAVIGDYEALGREVAGREVAHVLLLHANTINRDYLGAVLSELVGRGYQFVTLGEALRDPVYREPVPPSVEGGSLLARLAAARMVEGAGR